MINRQKICADRRLETTELTDSNLITFVAMTKRRNKKSDNYTNKLGRF